MRPQIVLFGDSITEQSFRAGGWGAALADTYSRKVNSTFTILLFLTKISFLFILFNYKILFWFVCNVLKADIVNRGYGGYNTRWALFLLHHLFPLVSFFFFSSLGHCSCSSFRLCFVH
jgi:hypothetical protein